MGRTRLVISVFLFFGTTWSRRRCGVSIAMLLWFLQPSLGRALWMKASAKMDCVNVIGLSGLPFASVVAAFVF